MFAIAFDLTVKEATKHHPKSVAAAYADIGATLARFGFRWVQGSIWGPFRKRKKSYGKLPESQETKGPGDFLGLSLGKIGQR